MHTGVPQRTRQWPLLLAVVIAQLLWMELFLLSGTRALLLSIFLGHDAPKATIPASKQPAAPAAATHIPQE